MTPEEYFRLFLDEIGLLKPELADTPRRFTTFLKHFVPSEKPDISLFSAPSQDGIWLHEMPFYSLCEHHLLPFFGVVSIGMVPKEYIAGLSGVACLLQYWAHRPQIQERLAVQLAEDLMSTVQLAGVVVEVKARHLCMEMQGIRSKGQVECIIKRGEVSNLI